MNAGDELGSNCTVFLQDIDNYISDFRENGTIFSLLLLRINEVSGLNNSSDEEVARIVSQKISGRLITCINKFSSIYRLSNGYFATIVRGNSSLSPLRNLDDLHGELHQPVQVDLDEIYMKVSIGYVEMSMDVKDSKVLLAKAIADLKLAKSQADAGRGFKRCWYDCSENEQFEELKHALVSNELQVVGLPIVNMNTSKVEILEIILYWEHKKYGQIDSLAIVELASRNNYLFEIATYVVKQFMAFYLNRIDAFSNVYFSINISLPNVVNIDLIKYVLYLIDKSGIKRSKLILGMAGINFTLSSSDEFSQYLPWLKQQGIRVSIDDSGDCYLKLDLIRNLGIEIIKINKTLIAGVDTDSDKFETLSSLIQLFNHKGLVTVIEGVDDIKQQKMISKIGVEGLLVKGSFYKKPMLLNAMNGNSINDCNKLYA